MGCFLWNHTGKKPHSEVESIWACHSLGAWIFFSAFMNTWNIFTCPWLVSERDIKDVELKTYLLLLHLVKNKVMYSWAITAMLLCQEKIISLLYTRLFSLRAYFWYNQGFSHKWLNLQQPQFSQCFEMSFCS